MNSNSIFRVRPISEFTLDELQNSYLWFSRPTEFKGDYNDANIGAFITDTPAIAKGLKYANPNFHYEEWYEKMSHIGICCFTRHLPTKSQIKKFSGCKSGKAICIEYNRAALAEFFEKHPQYPIVPCFRRIQYASKPTILESLDQWSILWDTYNGFKTYKTIPGILNEHPRVFDEFIFRLLTRISSKFKHQEEERIILGGCFIPSHEPNVTGYRIPIPNEITTYIYVYPSTPLKFKHSISQITELKDKIVSL